MTASTIYSNDPARGWLPWGALAPFLCVVFIVAPLLGVSNVLQSLQLLDAKDHPLGLVGLLAFLIVPFSSIGLVVLAWVHFVDRRSLATIGLGGADRAKTFWRGLAVGLATSFAVVAAIWMAGGFDVGGFAKAFESPSALMNIGLLLVGFGVQSSVEEIVFRGWLLSAIARKFNIVAAVVLTSLVFTLLHYGPQQHWLVTTSSFLSSAFTCCWALNAGNIWPVMGWHAGWNWLLAVGFELPITGLDAGMPALIAKLTATGPAYLTGGTQGPEGSFICSLFFVGAIALLIWRFARGRETLCGGT